MSNHEQRAKALIAEAESKLRAPSGFMSFFTGGAINVEEAAELFSKAANYYKLAKNNDAAGETYVRAGELYLQSKVAHEAASCFVNASGVFRKTNVDESIKCLQRAIEYYTSEGRFSIAAKYQKEIAEIYEAAKDFARAAQSYQLAADYFEGEGAGSAAGKCLIKVAEYAATVKEYDRAISIFEQIGDTYLQNNLLRYSAKDLFLASVLCALAIPDAIRAKQLLETYQVKDHTFSSTRECKFLSQIVLAFEENDGEAFTVAVRDYDRILKVNPWQTSILFRVKELIQDDDEALT